MNTCENILLDKDTFIVKDNDTFIVYSPYSNLIVRVTDFPYQNSVLRDELSEHGFFSDLPESVSRRDDWDGFTSVSFLLTRRCNLRCIYCYALSQTNESMPIDLALGALEWFIDQLAEKQIRITFHGGGEPTLEEELIKAIVKRTNELKLERDARYLITTNGTANRRFTEWMLENRFGISISMDGPPEIQNRNRPTVSGLPSSDIVENNIRYLVNQGYPFTIRMTYSPCDDMHKIVGYFASLGIKSLHLEPLFPHGRLYDKVEFGADAQQKVHSPDGEGFVLKFVEALDLCKKYGICVHNGHVANFMNGIGYFCGSASAKSMVVTHDGCLSGCLEVVDSRDSDMPIFKLGEWKKQLRSFDISQSRVAFFQTRHADAIPLCRDCFARYTCAGGCSVKAVRATGKFLERDISYCQFTRLLIPILIKRIAIENRI